MAISINLRELDIDFEIFGILFEAESFRMDKFSKDKHYSAFAIKRKLILEVMMIKRYFTNFRKGLLIGQLKS